MITGLIDNIITGLIDNIMITDQNTQNYSTVKQFIDDTQQNIGWK
jgi:hypothetical protein